MEATKFHCLICSDQKNISEINKWNRQSCHKFCVIMCRYLNLDSLKKAETMNISIGPEAETFREIFCCNNCQIVVKSVCDIYDSLESIRLQLNGKIQTVSEIMMETSINSNNSNSENGNFDYDEDERGHGPGSRFRQMFLKRVLDKQSRHDFPHLSLEKCSLTQPFVNTTSVKIENDDIEEVDMEAFSETETVQNLISTENYSVVIKTEVDDDDHYSEQINVDHNHEENYEENYAKFENYEDNGDRESITEETDEAENFVTVTEEELAANNDDLGQDPLENCDEKFTGRGESSSAKWFKLLDPTDKTKSHPWQCKICGKILRSSKTQHLATHSGRNYKCGDCGLSFKHRSSLSRHITGRHSAEAKANQATVLKEKKVKDVPLPRKTIQTKKKKILPRPKVGRHRDGRGHPWKCHICDKILRSSRKQHLASHSTEKEFQCDECDLRFKHRPSLSRHKLDSHSQDVANVREDQKNRKDASLPEVTNLGDQNKNSRPKGLPWSCKICGKVVRGSKKQHFESHSTEKGFQCEDCGKTFKHRANLAHHKRSKHSPDAARPWEETNFASLLRVTVITTETDDQTQRVKKIYHPWKCNICGKVLRSSKKQHMDTHAGGKKFQCHQCGLSFRHRSSLARHKVVHSQPETNVPE